MKLIIIAAGKGTRLKPFTNLLPKPLFRVQGEALVERSIKYFMDKGIDDITIVIGYMYRKMLFLKEKYKNIKFIYNDKWNEKNNYYSVISAKNELNDDCLIISGDIFINIDFLDRINLNKSTLFVQKHNSNSFEWEPLVDNSNRILGFEKKALSGYVVNCNLLFLKKEIIDKYISELEKSEDGEYYEDSLPRLYGKADIFVEKLEDNTVIEIDSIEDAINSNLVTKIDVLKELYKNIYNFKQELNSLFNKIQVKSWQLQQKNI